METVRCGSCNRKLAEAEFIRLAIKCPRCGTLNQLMAMSHTPARPGASNRKEMPCEPSARHDL
ncbi:MAG: Com family DNA-binding transcriptional regulator [Gallionella sp.]|nr:Com family DNA-binding transcriptional regulator [Gallionella sp.]MDD4947213.1 Com family DNA-binding transcriptional regulator [Gallionella sp.]MDD5611988.1 Com family DNA-binding transcriptional regulator [Gallionella sp.]